MGGKKKRKSSSSTNMWNSKSKKKKSSTTITGIDEGAYEHMFAEIADEEDPTTASMEGIFAMGEKLGVDATEDIRILVLLWKMGCKGKPSQVSKDEWMQGCNSLHVDSWEKLKGQLPACDTGFLDQHEFKDFYKFCFQFNRQGTHRTLDKELVIALLRMVLQERIPKDRLEGFCLFLEQSKEDQYQHITLDQWTSFLDFCYECEDLSSYDESTSAWPVLIDEFVDYMERNP